MATESEIQRLTLRLNPNLDDREVFIVDGVLTEDAVHRLRPGMHESLIPLLDSHEELRAKVASLEAEIETMNE